MRHAARLLVNVVAATAAFLLADALLAGVDLGGIGWAIVAGAVTGALNVLLRPALIRLALPVTVLTLGVAAIVLDGAVVLAVGALLPAVHVDGLVDGIVVALILAAVAALLTSGLAIDDDERAARHLELRAARDGVGDGAEDAAAQPPGLLFLEIDGLARDVLGRAMRDGNAPALAAWLAEGTHRLIEWETDWSSQTGCCQAGLLHHETDDVPAFRWWDKERGTRVVTVRPRHAAEIERRISDGRGLLHADGGSRANLFSGDAPHALLTASKVLDVDRGPIGRDYFAYFASPYNLSRTLLLALADIVAELHAAAQQRRRDVRPRIHRGLRHAFVRAWATVVQRDLQVESVLADSYAGRPVAYTTFLGYDEVAHLSGIERPDTLAVLRRLDDEIRRMAQVVRHAPRRYEIVVLSDHGQTQGAPFRHRYGVSLDELVRDACDIGPGPEEADENEALNRLNAALTEASEARTRGGRVLSAALRRRRVDGEVRLGARPAEAAAGGDEEPPEVVVMPSGCFGGISFPRLPGRVTLEELERRYPRLLPTLRGHPGIAFLLVRSAERGGLVLGARGVRCLDGGELEGEDPLSGFGEHAAAHVARTNGFANCPDIVVNSTYWEQTEEVAPFEERLGSHGGLGGPQSFPFVLAPASLPLPEDRVIGAEPMHRVLRGWLAHLGHDAYAR
jgi:uncharacterized membrane protein YvlD (DUF360 family)